MTRISKEETLARMTGSNPPKFAITGHSKSGPGRVSMLLRVSKSLTERIDLLCVGPSYLIWTQAMTEFLDRLDAEPDGHTRTIEARTFDPTPEDFELLKRDEEKKLLAKNN